jgi:replicative DNA helicase
MKVPPHDGMAEKAVLGGILIDNAAITDVAEIIQPKHFYFQEHKLIYEAILGLFDKNQPIDVVTVTSQLKADGHLVSIGDASYLGELIDSVPTSAYVKHYAEIVKNTYIKRTLITVASTLVEKSFEDQGNVQELLDMAESEIFSLSQAFLHRDFISLRDLLATSFDRLEKLMKSGGEIRGVPTGFKSLDSKLAGMQDSNLIILAARPGVGKTAFSLNIATHVALKEKMPVGFFSLEMSKEELVDRLLVGQADIDAWRLKTNKLSDSDFSQLTQAMGDLSEAPIFIDDTPGASILEMRTKARKMKIEHDLKLIVVDYLQLAVPGKRFESRVQEVGYISQNLKNLARELQIPVLAISQLNRAIEHRGAGRRPQLADLRESGSIEQDADVVMFLYSEDDGAEELMDTSKRMIKLAVAKHRNGATGEIDLMFRGDRVRFYDVEGQEEN